MITININMSPTVDIVENVYRKWMTTRARPRHGLREFHLARKKVLAFLEIAAGEKS